MSLLVAQQQAMLAVLFDWPSECAMQNIATYTINKRARGIKAYQANGHALAQRALQGAYPVLAQLLGAESFDALARAYWHAEPPTCGDVTEWGADLPAFVRGSAQLREEPYLGDVAALEWALHHAASAADAEVDAASFGLLSAHDPAELHVQLAPGCAVVASAWPVVSIINAHVHQTPALDQVGQLVQAGAVENALVWRHGLRTQVRAAQTGEAAFVTALLNGQTLGNALDQVPMLDVSAWLAMAVQSGLLLGVRLAAVSNCSQQ